MVETRSKLKDVFVRALVIFGAIAIAVPAAAPSPIQFEEIAKKAGLQFTLRKAAAGQFHKIELTGGGPRFMLEALIEFNLLPCGRAAYREPCRPRPYRPRRAVIGFRWGRACRSELSLWYRTILS